jgi:phosphohistidine swiveling domain-containing protein
MTMQAPPTATFDPRWEDPADAQYTWNRGMGPYPRLYENVMRAYADGQRRCWEAVASPMAKDHIVRFVDGWMYQRGPSFDADSGARLQQHGQRAAVRRDTGEGIYFEEYRPECIEIVTRLRNHPRPSRPHDELVRHLEECMEAQAHIMGDLHWRMAAGLVGPGGAMPTFQWPKTYAEITGRPESEASTLVAGLANVLTGATTRMRKLARIAAAEPDLMAAVEAGDTRKLDDDRPVFKKFRSGFKALLREYGQRTGAGWGSAAGTAPPTWNVRPAIPLKLIAMYARTDLDEAERKDKEMVREQNRLLRVVRRQLAGDSPKLSKFEFELARARRYELWTEDHNYWMDQSSAGIVRDAAHAVGLRLVRDKVIDDPEDVLHLSLDELHSPPPNARSLVESRKKEHERRKELDPPMQIGTPGEPGRMPPPDEGEGHVGQELRGVAASSGKYTGRARVCMPSPIPPDVEDGDIMIAVDAGPDWTPLFAILGAVVLDKGAAWQHAAVMAREFGIPAVTGTKEGTSVIKDGATITVDADAGVVLLGD